MFENAWIRVSLYGPVVSWAFTSLYNLNVRRLFVNIVQLIGYLG